MNRLSLLCFVVAATVSCSASYPVSPSAPTPVAFQIYYTTWFGYAAVGRTYSFRTYVLRSDGAYEEVTSRSTWSSSDPAVLRPGTAGAFAASDVGSVEVVARYEGFTSTLPLFVIREDRQSYPFLFVAQGAVSQLVARVQQTATASQLVTDLANWSSSNPAVARVAAGRLTTVAPGTTQITVSYGGMSAFYGVSIQPRSQP